MIQIKSRWTGAVLFEADVASMKLCVVAAISAKVSLRGSDLRGSNLRDSDLSYSNLRDSDLSGSNLSGSNLSRSNLSGSNLRDSNLSGSNLSRSNLSYSNLRGSDLSYSNLSGSNLSRSNLSYSNLRGSNLSGSNLSGSDLTPIRDDIWAVLSAAPAEAAGLREAVANGKIDGSCYQGECACLVGTIAKLRDCGIDSLGNLKPNGSRPAESFFMAIKPGDTPEKSQHTKLALGWIDEWIANMKSAFGPSTVPQSEPCAASSS